MSNKPREPMTKPEEVIAWAEETKAGNGEAFTMLKKEEQLLIAKFILAMRDHIKALQNGQGEKKPAPSPETTSEAPTPEESKDVVVELTDDNTRRQTNMEYFKANNVPMTRAYQMYCTWRNCDIENRTVFDEERKAWLKAAGFAFWLNLAHE